MIPVGSILKGGSVLAASLGEGQGIGRDVKEAFKPWLSVDVVTSLSAGAKATKFAMKFAGNALGWQKHGRLIKTCFICFVFVISPRACFCLLTQVTRGATCVPCPRA